MNVGKIFIYLGIFMIIIGLLWSFIGKLPGDITVKKGNVVFHFPLMTSIIISIILSLLMYFFGKFR